jgi:hypothetical protein
MQSKVRRFSQRWNQPLNKTAERFAPCFRSRSCRHNPERNNVCGGQGKDFEGDQGSVAKFRAEKAKKAK